MPRRTLISLLAVVALAPAVVPAQDRDWRDSSEWTDESSPDGYDVDVDVGGSGEVTFETFHGSLSEYGDWVPAGSYGRVWRPRVAAGWRPYYYGRWEWTNEGWLWASDEPWGWAAYHYGRWAFDDHYGWVWVPGYQWAPAWVSWRYSGDVVGWAPLAPGLSVYVSSYPFVDFWWTFVPTVRFVSVPVYTVAYAPSYTRHYYHRTAPAPARPAPRPGLAGAPRTGPSGARPAPTPAWGGPAPRAIEQRIGRPVTPARVVTAPSPGAARTRPGEIAIYRPGGRAAPASRPGSGPALRGDAAGSPARSFDGGRGRAPGVMPTPGRGGARGGAAPARIPERGPATAGEERRDTAQGGERRTPPVPAWRNGGSGGGNRGAAVPAPVRRGNGERREQPREEPREQPREDRGAPAWRGDGGGGGGSRPPPAPAQSGGRGGGGGQRESRGNGGGDHGGGRPAPAPRR